MPGFHPNLPRFDLAPILWSRKPDAERQSEIVGWSMANHLRAELQTKACMACFGFIEAWSNPVRLHSSVGYSDLHRLQNSDGDDYSGTVITQVCQHSTEVGQDHVMVCVPGRRRDLAFLIRIILAVAGVVTTLFVAANSANFGIVQGMVGLALIAAAVVVLALWRR
jgi:hypothetical protein